MRPHEAVTWNNLSATPANFQLGGGSYEVDVVGTFGGGSVTLKKQAQDGVTLAQVLTPFTANGIHFVDLPPGTYQLTIVTATGVYARIARIPGD
jgi:hypothetical protein